MPRFMLNRQVLEPPAYVERSCVLVKYQLPLLPYCFILCHEPSEASPEPSPTALLEFFMSEAERLAYESVGDSEAFMLIHSGSSIRKRSTWHLHVFVIQHRWQKAWVYSVLAIKNISLALYHAARRACGLRNETPNPSIEGTHKRLRLLRPPHVKR
jgi:hypothetical protein